MVSSAFCCAIGLTLFSGYDFFKNEGIDVEDYNWIPLACFSIVIFSANLGMRQAFNRHSSFTYKTFSGVVNLPFLIMTEISPLKIKDIIYSINVSFSWVLAYLAVQVNIVNWYKTFKFLNILRFFLFRFLVFAYNNRCTRFEWNTNYFCSRLLSRSNFLDHLSARNKEQKHRGDSRNNGKMNPGKSYFLCENKSVLTDNKIMDEMFQNKTAPYCKKFSKKKVFSFNFNKLSCWKISFPPTWSTGHKTTKD